MMLSRLLPFGPALRGLALSFTVAFGVALGAHAAAPAAVPAATTPTSPAAVADYRLGTGDVLHIVVYQNPDLTLDARVSDVGLISFPLLGSVKIGGLTVSQAEQTLETGLQKGQFVKNPQVTIVIVQVKGNQVSVLGQVNRPGRYPLEQAEMRLSDVLALAGGIATPVGSDTVTVQGQRNGRPFRLDVDLPQVFAATNPQRDILVQNNDVVWVDRAPMIYIYGEVQRPGPFRLERGMTLMQALASGGGLTQRGTERGIRVHRKGADNKTEVLNPGLDEQLKDGDVVYVRESLF